MLIHITCSIFLINIIIDQDLHGDSPDPTIRKRKWWIRLTESHHSNQLFRAVSLVNLVILAISIPFYKLTELSSSEQKEMIVSYQFRTKAFIDFLLACVYTLQLLLKISYHCYLKREKKVCFGDQ